MQQGGGGLENRKKKNVCVVLDHSLTKDLKWNAKGKPVV